MGQEIREERHAEDEMYILNFWPRLRLLITSTFANRGSVHPCARLYWTLGEVLGAHLCCEVLKKHSCLTVCKGAVHAPLSY